MGPYFCVLPGWSTLAQGSLGFVCLVCIPAPQIRSLASTILMVLASDIILVLDIAVKMIRMLAELLAPGRFQDVLGMPRTSMLQNRNDGNVAAVAVEGHTEKCEILSSMASVFPQAPKS